MIELKTALMVVAVLGTGLVLVTPGATESVRSIVTNSPEYCTAAPYAWTCVCPENEDKQFAPLWEQPFGKIKYTCVPEIQPSACNYPIIYTGEFTDEFREEVFGCAREYISNNFPDCPSIDCDDPYVKDISYVLGNGGYAMMECRDPLSGTIGQIRWHVTLSLQDGSLHPVLGYGDYCR